MSKILTEVCSIAGCGAMVHGEEEITMSPFPPSHDLRAQHGHLILEYAEGLLKDLEIKAVAAGWHWTNQGWLCGPCANQGSVIELANLHAELVARSLDV